MIAEQHDVHTVSKAAASRVVRSIVTLTKLHVRGSHVLAIESCFRQIGIARAKSIVHVIISDDISAPARTCDDILVSVPHDIVFDQAIGRAVIDIKNISTSWFRIRRFVHESFTNLATITATERDRVISKPMQVTMLNPAIRCIIHYDMGMATSRSISVEIFDADASSGRTIGIKTSDLSVINRIEGAM